MNALVYVNGEDVTEATLLEATKLNSDSSKRITTGNITLMGLAPDKMARYDDAFYDVDYYALDVRELYSCTIRDGRDGTKLFDGYIMAMDMVQTDAESPQVLYQCDIADHAIWLDRSICWDSGYTVAMPCSDQALITALVAHFCPNVNSVVHIGMILPTIMQYDWLGKSCRQVLDDVASMSGGEWRVDFDGYVWYGPAANAPLAPFTLSTDPDYVTSFPVRVDSFKRDFNNPINRAFVRGAIDGTGLPVEAEFADPVSIDTYGEFAYSLVDDQTTTQYDAQLRAKTMVLKYAWPLEQGSFTIWKDDLKCGMRVTIREESLGIDADYTIRQLSMEWKDPDQVEYRASFGAAQPDLEAYLRLLDQRTKWKASVPLYGAPLPGSVTDDSISDDGLHSGSISSVDGGVILTGSIHAASIGSVSGTSVLAGTIQADKIGSVNGGVIQAGSIQAGSIGSVNGGVIVTGSIQSPAIGSVNAGTITVGQIQHSQIGSINASTITVGVILSDQLGNKIIDDLAKYADALRPVRIVKTGDPWPPALPSDDYPPGSFFYFEPNGHFYKMDATGTVAVDQGTDPDALTGHLSVYQIGKLSAKNINGLIAAGQIGSIDAGQISGSIQAGQIGSVNGSTIQAGTIQAGAIGSIDGRVIQAGSISAGQIASVNGATISTGSITADKIASINGSTISAGSITATQIGSVNGGTINVGTVGDSQIASLSGGKITAGSIDSSKLYADNITVGGSSGHPGKINVVDGAAQLTAQVGTLTTGQYGGWFKVFGAGGTDYNTAKVYTNSAGSLFIRDADLSISGSSSTIATSPTSYDATYTSLAITITTGSDATKFISRGMVASSGGSKVVSVVRSPTDAGCGEVAVYKNGTFNILLDGTSGICRADGGFKVGGSMGRSTAIQVTATDGQKVTLTWTLGVLTNATIP